MHINFYPTLKIITYTLTLPGRSETQTTDPNNEVMQQFSYFIFIFYSLHEEKHHRVTQVFLRSYRVTTTTTSSLRNLNDEQKKNKNKNTHTKKYVQFKFLAMGSINIIWRQTSFGSQSRIKSQCPVSFHSLACYLYFTRHWLHACVFLLPFSLWGTGPGGRAIQQVPSSSERNKTLSAVKVECSPPLEISKARNQSLATHHQPPNTF